MEHVEGDHARVAVGNVTRTRGGAQLLELPRYNDSSGGLCTKEDCLIIVDYLTDFFKLSELPDTSASAV